MLAYEHPTYFGGIAALNTILGRGQLYAIVEQGAGALAPLLHATLVSAQVPACLVSSRASLDETMSHGALPDHGRLTLLEHACGPAARDRLPGMAAELAEYGVDRAAVVLLDHAETLFGGDPRDDAAVLRQLREWAARDDKTIVLLLRTELAVTRTRAPEFAGIARVHGAADAAWETCHWHHARGVAGASTQRLLRDGSGFALASAPCAVPARQAEEPALLVLAGALAPHERHKVRCQVLDDEEALALAAAGQSPATLLLPFSRSAPFDALVRTVHALRQRCARDVKIVIREMDLGMRQAQEALLQRVGVTLVVPAGMPLSRCVALCAALGPQVFTGVLPESVDALLDAAPAHRQGYLAPAAFVGALDDSLQHSQQLRIECALVRLRLARGVTATDALRQCDIRRAGDLMTADGKSLYVFLYACGEGDVEVTLERLFRLPYRDLFDGEARFLTARDIGRQRDALARQADLLPDLGAFLAAPAAAAATRIAVPAPALNGPASFRYAAPAPAQRRTLAPRAPATLQEQS